KKFFLLASFEIIFSFFSCVYAQVSNKINYQAIARDVTGAALMNQSIAIRLSILDGSGGPVLYSEKHSVTTNQFGLFTLQIGDGTVLSGDFNFIVWSSGN